MKWENRDINVVEWENIPKFPPLLMGIRRKRCFDASLQVLVLIYLWITISHLLVCLPNLELKTFEQHVCSIKIGYPNALSLETSSSKKKERGYFEQCTSNKKAA